MLLFRKQKILFVHIQKTGGTSVRHILRKQFRGGRELLDRHAHARNAMRHMGAKDYAEHYSFAFVRNPWDRMASWYIMFRAESRGRGGPPLCRAAMSHGKDFASFVTHGTDVVSYPRGDRSCGFSQLDYITDGDGKIIVNDAYRFEDFNDQCLSLAARLGFRLGKVPHKRARKRKHYSRFYTPALRDLIAERFSRDIEAFGYKFEEK